MQATSRFVIWTFLFTTAIGCKDQAKCDEALSTARKSLQDDFLDLKLARQWRDHAGKLCGAGTEIESLDKDILAKEQAIAKEAEEKAEKEAENGKKAMEVAGKLWKNFGKLEDDDKTSARLKQTRDKVKKMSAQLAPEYEKQVNKFNTSQYNKHKKSLKD